MSDPFEHFVSVGEDGAYVGHHAIIEMWGVENHTDSDSILASFISVCEKIGATVLFSHIHPFGIECGTTGVIVLAESHLSWHHYPECKYLAIDIFVCGSLHPENGFDTIEKFWKPKKIEYDVRQRGLIPSRSMFIEEYLA